MTDNHYHAVGGDATVDEGRLRLVRELVNTYDVESGTEALPTPADLRQWLRHQKLMDADATVTYADLERAVRLREALRDLLAANHDGTKAERAAEILTATARHSRLRIHFTPSGDCRLVPAASSDVDRALGELLVVVAEAMSDGRWRRLKVCRNGGCRWAFYDTSRGGTGKWCSMAVCGNRRKARAWRERQRQASSADQGQ